MLELGSKYASKGVGEVAHMLGIKALEREADKNTADPARGIGRAAASTALVYGGMAAVGAGGGGSAAAVAPEAGAAVAAPAYTTAAADSAAASAAGGYSNFGASSVPSAVDLGSAGGVQSTSGPGVSWTRMGDAVSSMAPPRKPQYPVQSSNVVIDQPDLEAIYGVG